MSKEKTPGRLEGKNIKVGMCACGGVPEAFELLSALRKEGADLEIVMTPSAAKVFSPIMVQRESNKPVLIEQFELPKVFDDKHNRTKADLFLIAPASADTVNKAACGIADNLLTTNILAARCPVAYILRCNPAMYEKPVTKRHIAQMIEDGAIFLNNEDKPNKYPPINEIIDKVVDLLK